MTVQVNYVASETDEAGNTKSYTYDTNGNKISVTDGEKNVVNYSYNDSGNVTSVSSYASQNTYLYNGTGNISAINHNNFTYQFNYDVFNNLISTKIGDVALTTNTYSPNNGNLTKTLYANGDYFEYTYDNYDNVTKVIGYTKATNTTKTFAEFVYNKKGLVSKTVDNSSDRTTYYYYDFNGSTIGEYRQTDEGCLSYYLGYDADGNKVEKTTIDGKTKVITSGTDEDGNSFISNDGITVSNITDDFGRTTQVKTSQGEGKSVYFTDYEYANGKADNSTTNLVSKLTQTYGPNEINNFEYEYDANGNITKIKNNGTIIASYEYDRYNQLSISYDRATLKYTYYNYDHAGNITSVKEHDVVNGVVTGAFTEKTYTYGDEIWKDKLTAHNGQSISYDASGNPINYRDGMTFAWENGRVLESITTDTATLEMKYDYNSMRTQKKVGNVVTNYYYDSNNNLIGLSCGDNTLFFYYDSNGMPTSFAHNGTMYYYVKNLQGDITQIVDYLGNVVVTYIYDVWDKILSIKDGSNNVIDSTNFTHIAILNPFRYRGYLYDEETGLYYLQSRYYDPIVGRFLNADDIQFIINYNNVIATNTFAYCGNNSIKHVDFLGTAYTVNTKNSAKFNCYAYALGYNNKRLRPGSLGIDSSKTFLGVKSPYTVYDVKNAVLTDFRCLGIQARSLKSKNAKLNKGEYLIAIRVAKYLKLYPMPNQNKPSYYVYDYHFMKKNPNTGDWWHKAGILPIQNKGKINPDLNSNWYIMRDREYRFHNEGFPANSNKIYKPYYNSRTEYIAVKRNFVCYWK